MQAPILYGQTLETDTQNFPPQEDPQTLAARAKEVLEAQGRTPRQDHGPAYSPYYRPEPLAIPDGPFTHSSEAILNWP